jgi:hypothetical protein
LEDTSIRELGIGASAPFFLTFDTSSFRRGRVVRGCAEQAGEWAGLLISGSSYPETLLIRLVSGISISLDANTVWCLWDSVLIFIGVYYVKSKSCFCFYRANIIS